MPEGTVLFSSQAPIGYIAVAANEVTTNQGFKSVVPKSVVGTEYVYLFLKRNTEVIENRASNSTGLGMKQGQTRLFYHQRSGLKLPKRSELFPNLDDMVARLLIKI